MHRSKRDQLKEIKTKFNIVDETAQKSQKVDAYMLKLGQNNNKLDDAIRYGAQSENIAKDIKINLQAQSEKMDKMDKNLHEIQRELGFSEKLIKAIS